MKTGKSSERCRALWTMLRENLEKAASLELMRRVEQNTTSSSDDLMEFMRHDRAVQQMKIRRLSRERVSLLRKMALQALRGEREKTKLMQDFQSKLVAQEQANNDKCMLVERKILKMQEEKIAGVDELKAALRKMKTDNAQQLLFIKEAVINHEKIQSIDFKALTAASEKLEQLYSELDYAKANYQKAPLIDKDDSRKGLYAITAKYRDAVSEITYSLTPKLEECISDLPPEKAQGFQDLLQRANLSAHDILCALSNPLEIAKSASLKSITDLMEDLNSTLGQFEYDVASVKNETFMAIERAHSKNSDLAIRNDEKLQIKDVEQRGKSSFLPEIC